MKPCPFCGSTRVTITHENDRMGYSSWIRCQDCYVTGPATRMPTGPVMSNEDREAEATELWNTRVEPDA